MLGLSGSVHGCRWSEAVKPLEAGHKITKATPLFRKIDATAEQLDERLAEVREKMANAKN
jgi:methionyl-tRNA synthetase